MTTRTCAQISRRSLVASRRTTTPRTVARTRSGLRSTDLRRLAHDFHLRLSGGVASPSFVNQRVTITAGTMIITAINSSGMYVTDIDDRSCPNPNAPSDPTQNQPCFNSIFAYNFSLPLGVRPCDQLAVFQGSVQEFISDTQLLLNPVVGDSWLQDAWIDEDDVRACVESPMHGPHHDRLAQQCTATELEPLLKSSVVRASGVSWPTTFGPGVAACRPKSDDPVRPGPPQSGQRGIRTATSTTTAK